MNEINLRKLDVCFGSLILCGLLVAGLLIVSGIAYAGLYGLVKAYFYLKNTEAEIQLIVIGLSIAFIGAWRRVYMVMIK